MILSLLVTMAMLAFYDKHKKFVTSISTWLDDDLLMFLCPLLKPSITMVIKDTSVAKASRKSVLFCSIDLPFYIYL